MVIAEPGTTVRLLAHATAGLVGTIQVQVISMDTGDALVAYSTAGITESPSGTYTAEVAIPLSASAGFYMP